MQPKVKASIKLAPGQIGFYDERTGIYLSVAKNTADVLESMNVHGIKQAIKQGRISVTSGSLEEKAVTAEAALVADTVKAEPKKAPAKKQAVVEEVKVEPQIEVKAEEPAEAVVQEAEVVVEAEEPKAPAKKTTKKAAPIKKEEEIDGE